MREKKEKYSKEERDFIGGLKPIPILPIKEEKEKEPKERKEKFKESDWL
jgi:hypothetical protein